MLTLIQIYKTLQIGVFAYIVSSELIKPKHLLHFWFLWLEKLEKKYPKIAYPIGYCEKCFAGQIALWYFLFVEKFNFINLLLFISFAILATIVLKKLFYSSPNN